MSYFKLQDCVSENPLQNQIFDMKTQKKQVLDQIITVENRLKVLNEEDTKYQQRFLNQKSYIKRKIDVNNYKRDLDLIKTQNQINNIKNYQNSYEKVQHSREKQRQVINENRSLNLEVKKTLANRLSLLKQLYTKNIQKQKRQIFMEKQVKAHEIKEQIQIQKNIVKDYWKNRLNYFSESKKRNLEEMDQQKSQFDMYFTHLQEKRNQIQDNYLKSRNDHQHLHYFMNSTQAFTVSNVKNNRSVLQSSLCRSYTPQVKN